MDGSSLWGDSVPSWHKWADELDPTRSRSSSWRTWASDPSYGYGRPFSGGVDFDPLPRGETWQPISMLTSGVGSADQGIDAWLMRTHPEYFGDIYAGPGTGANAGQVSSPGTPAWMSVNKWDADIVTATQKVADKTGVYVPPNFVKAVMRLESGGLQGELSGQGAIGLMQVMPFWGPDLGLDLNNPQQNILAGVTILAQNYNLGDPSTGEKSWEWAAKRYLGLGGPDSLGTDANAYWDRVSQFWDELGKFAEGGLGGTQAPKGTLQWKAIWGGYDAPISQGFGYDDCVGEHVDDCFAKTSGLYGYGSVYSRNGQQMGHPGVDVGVVYGTSLYVPIGGTVICAGTGHSSDPNVDGCTDYNNLDEHGAIVGGDHEGRFQIQVAGTQDMLIFGHMNNVELQPGQQLKPGDFVGYSGGENGDHVHVEYRKYWGPPGTVTSSGYEEIDPRLALQGVFTGSFGQAQPGQRTIPAGAAGDWQAFMRSAAEGGQITGGYGAIGGLHDWIKQKLGITGGVPTQNQTTGGPPSGWSWNMPANPTTQPPTG